MNFKKKDEVSQRLNTSVNVGAMGPAGIQKSQRRDSRFSGDISKFYGGMKVLRALLVVGGCERFCCIPRSLVLGHWSAGLSTVMSAHGA